MGGLVHIIPALRNLVSICQARIDEDPYSRLTSQVKGMLWKFVCLQYD